VHASVSGSRRRDFVLGLAATCGLAALYFWPQGRFGFTLPDFWPYILHSGAAYPHSGDLGPLAFLPLRVWDNAVTRDWIRYIQLFGIVANFATFYALVFRLTRSNLSALFSVGIALCVTEFRLQNDPYLSNLAVLPVAAELLLGGLLVYLWGHWARPEALRLLATAALFAGSIAVYPACAPLALVFAAGAWLTTKPLLALGESLFFLTLLAAALLLVDRERATSTVGVPAFLANTFQALPAAYRATAGILHDRLSTTNRDTSFDRDPAIGTVGWLTAIAVAGIVFARLASSREKWVFKTCAVTGAMLWICGSAIPGAGLYFETFGIAMVITGLAPLLSRVQGATRGLATAMLATAVFFVVYGNVRANKLVAQVVGQPWDAFTTVQRAVDYGVFAGLSQDSPIAISTQSALLKFAPSSAEQQLLLLAILHRRFPTGKAPGGWLLRERLEPGKPRTVELFHLVAGKNDFQTDGARVYDEFVSRDDAWKFEDDLLGTSRGMTTTFRYFDDERALVDVHRPCGAVPLDDVLLAEQPGHTWSSGFYPMVDPPPAWYPYAGSRIYADRFLKDPMWRYMRESGEITFHADHCGAATIEVTLGLYSPLPGSADVWGGVKHLRTAVGPGGNQVTFTLAVPARGKALLRISAQTPAYPSDQLIPRTEGVPITDIHLMVSIDQIRILPTKGTGK